MINDGLILVLSQHPVFGWKFNVHSAEHTESGNIQVLGTPMAKQEEKRGTPEEIIRMIKLAGDISDQNLMKDYSKKKTFAEFKKDLTEETFNRYIRPRIESTNRKIVEIARLTDIDVYVRENLSNKFLYEKLSVRVVKTPTECLFNFVKDEKGFRYFISLTNEGREISLQAEQAVIISEKPATVLIGDEIHCVENIESKKLVPFFTKGYIEVPARSEETYLKSFVLKTMSQYEVKIQGIPVRKMKPEKEAVLLLERDFHNEFVLILWYKYNGQSFWSGEGGKKKLMWLDTIDGVTGICWYGRDKGWESELATILEKEGLVVKETNHYSLARQQGNPYSLIEWLNSHEEILQKYFTLEQHLEREYFTGTISMQTSINDKIDWFDVDIVVVAGEYRIPFNRFRKHILNGNKDFVLPDQRVLILPDEWFEKYYDLFRLYKDNRTSMRVKKLHTPLLQHALSGHLPAKEAKAFDEVLTVPLKRPEFPEGIKAELRPYQKEGFYWLEHLYKNNMGACLADDMGLGKTLQTITLLQYIYGQSEQTQAVRADGQFSLFDAYRPVLPASLVVAPTSLLHNWKNELRRFAPGLKVLVHSGNERLRTKDNEKIFNHYQVIVTSYGVVRNDIEYLRNYPFQMVILDESQYVKNTTSLAYKAVIQLASNHRMVLTGTPVENSLADLWAQFNFINEGLLGHFSAFKKDFIHKIVKEKSTSREQLLKKMIGPFMLRRTKEEVTPELPPLTQKVIYCDMTEAHQAVYEAEKNSIRNVILEAKERPELKTNSFIVLEGLNKLRQIANHPKLVVPDYTDDSGKFEQIIMSFENLRAANHKVLIFSSYVRHLNLLAEKFKKEAWKYAMLTGQTVKREEEINRFMDNDDISCFFISLKAGSTGLNLTVADYVFILDPWWNPAAEMQALSRAHRIGQEKPVIAYRFITSETVEEKIVSLQEAKTELFNTFVNNENPLSQLNWDEIEELFLT